MRHVLIAPSYSGFQGQDLSWESVGRKSCVSSMGGLMLFSLSWALAPPCMVFLCRWGLGCLSKQATAPGVAAGHAVQSRGEGSAWLLLACRASAHPGETSH